MKRLAFLMSAVSYVGAHAQADSASPLKLSGYSEIYYCYDFANPSDHTRPGFIYSHNRHNEVNLNLGYIKATFEKNTVRGNLAFMAGTYVNANLASEPGVLKNIFEANAGVKLSRNKNLWADAGIFASHIGFESAVGKDCWNLTRSILADNSPYYESGAKVSFTSDDSRWFLSALVLNGWQRIKRVDGNNTPAFGHQVTFKPNPRLTFNSSSFIGNDKPDSVKQMRYFHNFYSILQLHKKFGITLGFDVGAEQKQKHSSDYNIWYSPDIILRYSATEKVNISVRGEYYVDENGVIINTGTPNGFQTYGYSLNIDYLFNPHLVWRIEGRGFQSLDAIFAEGNSVVKENYFITTALAISF